MPDFDAWRANEQARAIEAWGRISEQPTTITIRRGTASGGSLMLDPQTVRVEYGSSAREDLDVRRGLNITPGVQRAVVFGVRNHPTVDDTDIQRSDRFVIDTAEFEVVAVIPAPGELQAICEART